VAEKVNRTVEFQ